MDTPNTAALRRTPLHPLHLAAGAKMVAFAGWDMPIQYAPGILQEHLHTRAHAGLFDVSHMGQAELHGADAAKALEALTPADVQGLKPGRQRYGLLMTESGGIFDDFMVANLGDRLFLVVNASRKAEDLALIGAALPGGVTLKPLPDRALIALQGPQAVAAIATLAPDIAALSFMGIGSFDIAGTPAIVSAADAPMSAGMSPSISGLSESTVAITCTSFLNSSGNSGRTGRSMRREVSVSFSVGRPSRLKKPPGMRPAA